MKNLKNELITSYLKVDLIKHQPTKQAQLWFLQTQKDRLFESLHPSNPKALLDELRDFNERIYPQSPRYGELYT